MDIDKIKELAVKLENGFDKTIPDCGWQAKVFEDKEVIRLTGFIDYPRYAIRKKINIEFAYKTSKGMALLQTMLKLDKSMCKLLKSAATT